MLGFLLISLLLTMADIFIIYNGNNNWKAWMGLLLFSSVSLVFLFRLYSDQPELILNETGIKGKSTQNKLVKWDILSDAYLHKVNNQTYICLVMNEDEGLHKDLTGIKKEMMEFNKEILGVQEINLNAGLLKCDKMKVLSLMQNLLNEKEGVERKNILNKFLLSDQ